jgi:hypothetical protein
MIRIGENYECVIEWVDAHLGGKRIKDIVPGTRGTPLTLVFEDDHALPLLCPDCGGALHVAPEDEDQVLEESSGLYLVGVAYVEPGEEPEGITLAFSSDPDADPQDPETEMQELLLHLDGVRRLACPDERREKR